MNEFSRAFLDAYERMPQWRRDQFDAVMRDTVELIHRITAFMEQWERQGIAAAEQHANTEEPS